MTYMDLSEQSIKAALSYIDENGIPSQYRDAKPVLLTHEGKTYPLSYVISKAIEGEMEPNEVDIEEAWETVESLGYQVENQFTLTIAADNVESTDRQFTMQDLMPGIDFTPVAVRFIIGASGDERQLQVMEDWKREQEKYRLIKMLPRLACQIFESQLLGLSETEREAFPVCQMRADQSIIRGLFGLEKREWFKKNVSQWTYVDYVCSNREHLIFYYSNLFTPIIFVQECLKRFGQAGDKFILIYKKKDARKAFVPQATQTSETTSESTDVTIPSSPSNPYSQLLLESMNLIFRGAPGTGKSYLAKQVATDIVSDGTVSEYSQLTDEQKKQIAFVQFHPSYDYSDFVEGLRPQVEEESMRFKLHEGVFMRFVKQARKNFEESHKTQETREKEVSVQEAIEEFFDTIEFGKTQFSTMNRSKFTIKSVDEDNDRIEISIPKNAVVDNLTLKLSEVRELLESGEDFSRIKDITAKFGKRYATQAYSYEFVLFNKIKEIIEAQKTEKTASIEEKAKPIQEKEKKYVFIIDEINRGEISKIFGELFFSIDPGYRGKGGEVSTKFANMHEDERFYVPENVYIIGTMNDIDRSVDSFDFAMRRRFRFVEIKPEDRQEMLKTLGPDLEKEAIRRMNDLNKAIVAVDDLNENYQIGASYFLKAKQIGFDKLWTDFLQPLLQEYIRGMYEEKEIMKKFAKAYGYQNGATNETDEED